MFFLGRVYVAHRSLRTHYVAVALTLFHSLSSGRVVLSKDLWSLRLGAHVLILLLIGSGSYRLRFCCCFLCFLLFSEQLKLSNFFLFCLSLLSELILLLFFPLLLLLTRFILFLRFMQFYLELLLLFHIDLLLGFVRWTWRAQRWLLGHSDLFCDCRRPLIVRFWIFLVGKLDLGGLRFDWRLVVGDIWLGSRAFIISKGVRIRLRLRWRFHIFRFNLLWFWASSSHFKFKIIK